MQRLQAAECTSGPLGPFRGYPGCHHPLRRTLGGRLASTLGWGLQPLRLLGRVIQRHTIHVHTQHTSPSFTLPSGTTELPVPNARWATPGPTRSRPRPARKTASHHATTTHWAVVSARNKPPHRHASMSLHPTGNLNERVPGDPQHTCTTSSGN